MTSAIVLVPPFINLAFGPLAGPAMLVAAGQKAGHDVHLVDFNERWISERMSRLDCEPRLLIGDHDCPSALRELKRRFTVDLALEGVAEEHAEIHARALAIVNSSFGALATAVLREKANPDVIGLSLMYREQLEPALALTAIARRLFPRALVIWGGAHVTAMRAEIGRDYRYGLGIDGFVFGYAEATWVEILNSVSSSSLPVEVVRAGDGRIATAREDLRVVPEVGDVSMFPRDRLTLPIQASRGCTHGVCSFCTYPHIEGTPRRVPESAVRAAIEQAVAIGAAISFKDSLVEGELLIDLARWIGGRAVWSACTKLDAKLPGRLHELARGGCRTLEIGLETLEPTAQRDARKRQPIKTFHSVLDAAERCGIGLVVNYITGFPRSDPQAEQSWLCYVQNELRARRGLVARLEHHGLQVERLSTIAADPYSYGVQIIRTRVWSSLLDWEATTRLITLQRPRDLVDRRPR